MKTVYFTAEPLFEADLAFWSSVHMHLKDDNIQFLTTRASGHGKNEAIGLLPDPRSIGMIAQSVQSSHAFPDELRTKFLETAKLWGHHEWDNVRYEELWYGYLLHIMCSRPDLILIWNRHRSGGCVLECICKKLGIPTRVVERTPWPHLISYDPAGNLLDTEAYQKLVTKSAELELIGDKAYPKSEAYLNHVIKSSSWWEQPETRGVDHVRKDLGINIGKKVVLFAGQVDNDVQNFHYNPHFAGNLDAFRAFLSALGDDDVFILGKHHPKSKVDPAAYQEILGSRGVWADQVSLDDCMLLVDHVAAVNSAVLFEASLQGKSVMSLGQTMLTGCGVFHEWTEPSGKAATSAWINEDAEQRSMRRLRHMALLEHLLEGEVYYYGVVNSMPEVLDAVDLAERISREVNNPTSKLNEDALSEMISCVDPLGFFWALDETFRVTEGEEYLTGRRVLRMKEKVSGLLPAGIRKKAGAIVHRVLRKL